MADLPMVMPSNRARIALRLNEAYPGRIGLLLSPDLWQTSWGLPYALDNGRFPVWTSGKEWIEEEFLVMCDKASQCEQQPLWVAVPDVVANAEETFIWYDRWAKVLLAYGFKLALVVQDGMTVAEVKRVRPIPDVIFVGGSTLWKWRSLPTWTKNFPRVHVGRVNTHHKLWSVQMFGAESSDGTGWWHKKQLRNLEKYLELSSKGIKTPNTEWYNAIRKA